MVRIAGFDIRLGKQVDIEKQNYESTLNNVRFNSLRTIEDPYKTIGGQEFSVPYYPLPMRTLYDVVAYSDVLRTVISALRKEIFRNGLEITEKFAKKCNTCGKEFEHPVDECDECKEAGRPSTDLREPDVTQKKALEKFIRNCNDNGQDILDVSSQINDDLETTDDGYMLAVKDYFWNGAGEMVGSIVVEVVRTHPMFIRICADRTGRPGRGTDGTIIKTCLMHRQNFWGEEAQVCPSCGRKLYQAFYKGEAPNGIPIYYIKGEIYHKSKYLPSMTYGFPPIFSVWMKVVTLMNQDNYMKNYYSKQRPPRGLLFVRTPNMNSLEKAWNWMLDMFKKNPHMIPPIAVEGENIRGNFVQFIDFMRSLDEMQWIETRNEFRRAIGAVYGVMPLFQADISTSGGLNNEGLQVTVTNRAAHDGQGIFNDGYYPWLLEQVNVTDYIMRLKPSEERDEMHLLQIEAQKIVNARAMQSMGYEVTLNEDNEFEFEPLEIPVTPPTTPTPTAPNPLAPFPTGEQRFTGEPMNVSRAGSLGGVKRNPEDFDPTQLADGVKVEMEHTNDKEIAQEIAMDHLSEDKNYYKKLREMERKADAPISSTSGGVWNPRYGARRRAIADLIGKIRNEVVKETGAKLSINKQDEGLPELADFITEALYSGKFEGVSKSISDLMKEYMIRAMLKGYPMYKIVDYINRRGGRAVTDTKAEMIARTETQALQNKIREWAYMKVDPEGKLKYKWLNPLDDRTTDICRNIVQRTKNGVSMEELKGIVEEESKKAGFEPREFTPHINCRSTYVRVM